MHLKFPLMPFHFLEFQLSDLVFQAFLRLFPTHNCNLISPTFSHACFSVRFIYSLFQDAVFTFSQNNSLNPLISSLLSRATGRAPFVDSLVLGLIKIYRMKQTCSLTLRSCWENEEKWAELISLH